MFDPTSRYYNLPIKTAIVIDSDGLQRGLRHVQRRFIPPSEKMTAVVEHTIVAGERLNNIAARYIGDPAKFWIICDANGIMRPDELTDKPGRRIKISMPGL